ncbi:hypothetical protein DPX16_7185 [Anabarilius grahami]|uniref:Uncharacterized protein n=1 Tax=Anabarilius grahami TaxID=495550 RepID=A0A3N0XMR0_ANAGA|nr:hypothetical protein DPX16_7185 [Anabarilius grahami]
MIPECPRIRCESGQNRSGLLREIRTSIRSEPFTDRYDVIPGRELGSRVGYHDIIAVPFMLYGSESPVATSAVLHGNSSGDVM